MPPSEPALSFRGGVGVGFIGFAFFFGSDRIGIGFGKTIGGGITRGNDGNKVFIGGETGFGVSLINISAPRSYLIFGSLGLQSLQPLQAIHLN